MPGKKNKKTKKSKGIRIGIWLLVLTSLLFSAFVYVMFLRPATKFKGEQVIIFVPKSKATKQYVRDQIKNQVQTVSYNTFLGLAEWSGYWKKIKSGRYVIEKNSSIFTVFRKLYGGRQDPVSITINKFRTNNDVAKYVAQKLEFTETEMKRFINNSDSLNSLGLTKETFMTVIIPNTYEIYWDSSPRDFMERMLKESNKFWNDSRIDKAKQLELSKEEVITIASIVEEETNDNTEKPLIASVYVNRLKKEMPLGADPTIKFALGNFMLKRITLAHIRGSSSSPYNTYSRKGLPPGPICTPSIASIDAVLKGEATSYLYFCAKADFSGSHSFASTAEEHFANARKYRKALDSLGIH
ncbi:MAG: endolytic transglycosylase MltG [Bacteroidota bacterium]|jgi:UPF0755 protein